MIAIYRPILHKYANEDVSLGSWFIGLEVEHIDERNMCCGTPPGIFFYEVLLVPRDSCRQNILLLNFSVQISEITKAPNVFKNAFCTQHSLVFLLFICRL